MRGSLRLLALALASVAPCALGSDFTAVASRTSTDYVRVQGMDRRYDPETYALGIGGDYSGPTGGPDDARVAFKDVVRAIAGPLYAQQYVPTRDPNNTKFLIMVYWGTTAGSGDPIAGSFRAANPETSIHKGWSPGNPVETHFTNETDSIFSFEQDDTNANNIYQGGQDDRRNATILGYDYGLSAGLPDTAGITPLHITRDDLLEEVRHNRYFVVLMAYDFQMLWKEKKHKLVWETRFSIRERENDFSAVLPSMAKYASQYFGKDTFGLIRRPLPEGEVEVGVPQTVASIPDAGASPSLTSLVGGTGGPEGDVQKWMSSTVPPELERRIDAYKRDRAALIQDLAARMKTEGADSNGAVDSFNTENSTRIAMLSRTAQGIRVDLAQIASVGTRPGADQPVNTLVKQFNAEVREMDVTEPILTHP